MGIAVIADETVFPYPVIRVLWRSLRRRRGVSGANKCGFFNQQGAVELQLCACGSVPVRANMLHAKTHLQYVCVSECKRERERFPSAEYSLHSLTNVRRNVRPACCGDI